MTLLKNETRMVVAAEREARLAMETLHPRGVVPGRIGMTKAVTVVVAEAHCGLVV